MIYGISFLFLGFLFVDVYFKRQDKRYLLLSALVFCYAGNFKIFITLQFLITLAIAVILHLRSGPRRILILFTATFVMFVVLYFPTLAESIQGTSLVGIMFNPYTNYIPDAIRQLGLLDIELFRKINAIYGNRAATISEVPLLFVAVLMYSLLAFGPRIIGLPSMVSSIFNKHENQTYVLAGIFILVGPLLTLFLSVVPAKCYDAYNNSVWFFVQSKYLLWLFLDKPIRDIMSTYNKNIRVFIRKGLYIILSVTAIFYSLRANLLLLEYFKHSIAYRPKILAENYLDVYNKLKCECIEGKTFISDDYWTNYILVSAGCKTVLFAEWGTLASPLELVRRRHELEEYWMNYNKGKNMSDLLVKYDVDYIVRDNVENIKPVKSDSN
jgi:hypothetical protein